ncbi:uncharacterized protein (DUF2141 family) [Lutibacter sp. Hel_I_33_5]|uniref:DUF2141 domain-containing protein n=1 Tax=Lutibacter sp. Hel_I_33_5 TaxID=1566289 RepID=UPI0011A558EF|nr:DUF2141 domain-containing protein [Lutibacter sp. Hel_I_33_5]TVZ55158.1 uncharacterized protein (DUF2141 family) [Lutibacter sp. Hel_I_33_5]
MKILLPILIAAALFLSENITAQNQTITATVINATSDKGNVSYALYDKDSFMKKPLQGKLSKIENGKSIVVFENVTEGEYSIICYHDKNENGIMDFNGRMPIEDFGSSNNVMAYGPPQFNTSKFTVSDKDVSLEIKF